MKKHTSINNRFFGNDPFRMSMIMMTGSLILLALFLTFWLKTVHEDETDILKKDANQVFVNTIRDIESRYFNRVMGQQIFVELDDPGIVHFRQTKIGISEERPDAGRFMERIDTSHIVSWNNHSDSVKVEIETLMGTENKQDHLAGSLSLFVISEDSTLAHPGKPSIQSVIPLLDSVFTKRMKEKYLPVEHKVIVLKGSTDSIHTLLTESYTDIPTGVRYAVALNNYEKYLLIRILPEFLFSLFLFSVIALAFLLIYKNLKKQHQLTVLKNDLISNITHELKTPITTVGVAIEALSNFDVLASPQRTQEYLAISKQELNRLSLLVDRVLKMSLFEQGATDFSFERVDFKKLIEEVLIAMKLLFERSRAKVHFEVSCEDTTVFGDPAHLSSVVYNLIDNALKYARTGVDPVIRIRLSQQGENLLFEVADNGIGIPPAYMDKVFEKFFRVPLGDLHKVKGYGLGLSYVASVIEKHRGRIMVKSDLETGTCFSIELPQKEGKK
jgi:signal transduction histidine kinase